jgi:hypothetical protein
MAAALVVVLVLAVAVVVVMPAAGAIITGETAVATSEEAGAGRTASKAVNNAGITGGGALATDGAFEHNNIAADMWQTQNGLGAGAAIGESITIDLLTGNNALPRYNLDGMRIWNFNEGGGGTDTAISIYDLETSSDGVNWTLRQDDQSLAQAPGGGLNGYDGVFTDLSASPWSNVRFVRITVGDTYRGNDDVAGLAEVMFSGEVPEPSFMVLVFAAAPILMRRRHRRG